MTSIHFSIQAEWKESTEDNIMLKLEGLGKDVLLESEESYMESFSREELKSLVNSLGLQSI